uniref:Uncharacterized protein n=1 Tax=Rhizophora mucronata TaxID=61149 RepID=A0A2P2K0U7_RHIMU
MAHPIHDSFDDITTGLVKFLLDIRENMQMTIAHQSHGL